MKKLAALAAGFAAGVVIGNVMFVLVGLYSITKEAHRGQQDPWC